MSGDSEDASKSTSVSETTVENLRKCRAKVLDSLRRSVEMAMQFELRDYERYAHFETVQVPTSFIDDSEDIGPREDLALLGIK